MKTHPVRIPGFRTPKYRATRTVYNGIGYASKAEAARAGFLDTARKLGLIRWWIGQPVFRLGCPENVYRPDFLVVGNNDANGKQEGYKGIHAEDVKGHATAKFAHDVKLWKAYGPCPLWIIRGNRKTIEIINPEPSS